MNKYEWIEAVMASRLSTGTKVFAFGLFKHMNAEGECFPGDVALVEVTGMSRGHFSTYRRTLSETGWIHMEPRRTKNGVSYTYSTPETAPNGEQTAPNGEQSAPNGEQSAPNGGMNTLSNTTSNTVRNTLNDAPVVADAPTVTSSDYKLEKEVPLVGDPSLNSLDSVAGAPSSPYEYMGSLGSGDFEGFPNLENLSYDYLANKEGVAVFDALSMSVEETHQPQIETEDYWSQAEKNIAEIGIGRRSGKKATLEEEW